MLISFADSFQALHPLALPLPHAAVAAVAGGAVEEVVEEVAGLITGLAEPVRQGMLLPKNVRTSLRSG